jgi:hypothetical protein
MIFFYRLKINRMWIALLLASLVGVRWILHMAGLIVLRPGWFLPVSLADILMKYALISVFDRFLSRKAAAVQT